MSKYLINYENAHWCGGELEVVVNASSALEAVGKAEMFMEETQRELFSDHYEDEFENEGGSYFDEQAYTVISVEVFDKNHPQWEFYQDPSQSEFYPEV